MEYNKKKLTYTQLHKININFEKYIFFTYCVNHEVYVIKLHISAIYFITKFSSLKNRVKNTGNFCLKPIHRLYYTISNSEKSHIAFATPYCKMIYRSYSNHNHHQHHHNRYYHHYNHHHHHQYFCYYYSELRQFTRTTKSKLIVSYAVIILRSFFIPCEIGFCKEICFSC